MTAQELALQGALVRELSTTAVVHEDPSNIAGWRAATKEEADQMAMVVMDVLRERGVRL